MMPGFGRYMLNMWIMVIAWAYRGMSGFASAIASKPKGELSLSVGIQWDCKGIRKLAQGADMLIMCSYLAEAEINDSDTELISRHILASPSEVGKIATHAGVKKLILTHIRKKSHTLSENDVQRRP